MIYSTRHSRGGSLMIWGTFSSSGKLDYNLSGVEKKTTDYMKMINGLSLAQEGYRLCGEEWIFQQDNAAIRNASITKKYSFEQKIRLLKSPRVLSRPQSYRQFMGIDCCKSL